MDEVWQDAFLRNRAQHRGNSRVTCLTIEITHACATETKTLRPAISYRPAGKTIGAQFRPVGTEGHVVKSLAIVETLHSNVIADPIDDANCRGIRMRIR